MRTIPISGFRCPVGGPALSRRSPRRLAQRAGLLANGRARWAGVEARH